MALVAEEAAGARALQLLVERGHDLVAVFTSASHARSASSVAAKAKSLNVPLRDARDVRDARTADWMREEGVQLLLNVHSLHIIDASVLAEPRSGAFNLHPGPLPERAGLDTPSWALYEGASRYGVTLHRMTPSVDAGAIAFADSFDIHSDDTGISLMARCTRHGLRLVEQLLEFAEQGEAIPAIPQDLTRRRWFRAGPPRGGRLNWHCPARHVADFVRACDYRPFASPWGFPRSRAGDTDLAILNAQVVDETTHAPPGTVAHGDGVTVRVAAGDAWVRVEKVEVKGQALAAAEGIPQRIRLQ